MTQNRRAEHQDEGQQAQAPRDEMVVLMIVRYASVWAPPAARVTLISLMSMPVAWSLRMAAMKRAG